MNKWLLGGAAAATVAVAVVVARRPQAPSAPSPAAAVGAVLGGVAKAAGPIGKAVGGTLGAVIAAPLGALTAPYSAARSIVEGIGSLFGGGKRKEPPPFKFTAEDEAWAAAHRARIEATGVRLVRTAAPWKASKK